MLKKIITLLFLVIVFKDSADCQEWINVKFKSVRCKILDESYGKMNKCFVKPISRNLSTLNLNFDIIKVVRAPIFIETKLFYRYITITRQIYPTTTFDFCAIMRGDGLFEKMTLFIIDLFKDSVPQLFHKCPFAGPLNLMNITITKSTVPIEQLFPRGTYKVFIGIIHNNSRVYQMEIQLEIASGLEKW
jgi:hypothetical protein